MRQIFVTKKYEFELAHMLSNHEAACKNVHGHSYKLEVTLLGDVITQVDHPAQGMIMDFKELKGIVKGKIIDRLDHAYLSWTGGQADEQQITRTLKALGKKVVEVPWRPTAENMALNFFDVIAEGIKVNHPNAKVAKVRVYETSTSYADCIDTDIYREAK